MVSTRWRDNDIYGHVNNAVYYSYIDSVINGYMVEQGVLEADVGSHAGMHDTSSFLFLDPSKLRQDRMVRGTGPSGNGVTGHPGRSTAEYGEQILEMQIDAAVRQIERLRETARRREQ